MSGRSPFSPASRCSSSPTRRVLPTPESPPSRTSVGRPAVASRTASSSSASSPTRPTKWLLVNRDGMYEVSPERGYQLVAPDGSAVAGGLEPEVGCPALGHDGAELGVHRSVLSLADTV